MVYRYESMADYAERKRREALNRSHWDEAMSVANWDKLRKELLAKFQPDIDPRSFIKTAWRVAEAWDKGATDFDICLMFGIARPTATLYLRQTGRLPPRIVKKLTVSEDGRFPEHIAKQQASWDRRHKMLRAVEAGAKMSEIAKHVGVCHQFVRQLVKRAERDRKRGVPCPLERYLCQDSGPYLPPPKELARRLRDVAERAKKMGAEAP